MLIFIDIAKIRSPFFEVIFLLLFLCLWVNLEKELNMKGLSLLLVLTMLFSFAAPVFAEDAAPVGEMLPVVDELPDDDGEELTDPGTEESDPAPQEPEVDYSEEPAVEIQEEPEESGQPSEQYQEPEVSEDVPLLEEIIDEELLSEPVDEDWSESVSPEAVPQDPVSDTQDDEDDPGYELQYVLRTDGTYWAALNEVTGTGVTVVVPATYEGVTVTTYSNNVSPDTLSKVSEIVFPETLREIIPNLFQPLQVPYGGVPTSEFGPSTRSSGANLINNAVFTGSGTSNSTFYAMDQSGLEMPSFISSHYVNGAYYAGKCLVRVDPSYQGDFTVKKGTVCILAGAFLECKGVKKVTLPSSVEHIGMMAFMNSGVTEINLPANLRAPKYDFLPANYFGPKPTPATIPMFCFYNCKNLKTVTMAKSLKVGRVGYAAFAKCSKLQSFDFTKVGELQSCAFVGAFDPAANAVADLSNTKYYGGQMSNINAVFAYSGLKTVIFGDGSSPFVPHMNFSYCTNLTEVRSNTDMAFDIGTCAFEGCNKISAFTLKPSYVESFAFYKAFDPKSKVAVDLSQASYLGGSETFAESGIYSVTFGDNTGNYVCHKCFYHCPNLTEVKSVTDKVFAIGTYTFEGCNKISKFEPKLGSVESYAFLNAFDPKSKVSVDLTNGSLGDFGNKEKIFFNSGIYEITFGENTDSGICCRCFAECPNLTVVNSTKSAGTGIGLSAFENCPKIAKFELKPGRVRSYAFRNSFDPKSNVTLDLSLVDFFESRSNGGGYIYTGEQQFANSGVKEVVFGEESYDTIPFRSFFNCTSLSAVTLGSGVKKINASAFEGCTKLAQDILANSWIEEVSYHAFYGTPMVELTIPSSLKFYSGMAFANMTKLKTINWDCPNNLTSSQLFAALNDPYELTSQGGKGYDIPSSENMEEFFSRDYSGHATKPVTLNIFQYPKPIENYGMGYSPFKMLTSIETVNIYCPVAEIPAEAFQGVLSLKHINLSYPYALKRIGKGAFEASGLEEAVLMNGVEYDGYVFEDCLNLKKVVVEDGVTEIKPFTFIGCKNLDSVSLPETLQTIGWGSFKDALKNAMVYIPASVTLIEDDAFADHNLNKPAEPAGFSTLHPQSFGDAGHTSDGKVSLIIAGDPVIETLHADNQYAYEEEVQLAAIPTQNVTTVYADETGTNLQAFRAYLSSQELPDLNVQPIPDEATLTVENAPKKTVIGKTPDTSDMKVSLNGTVLKPSEYTIIYDVNVKELGKRKVGVQLKENAGTSLVETTLTAKNFYPDETSGSIYDISGEAYGEFEVMVEFIDVTKESDYFYAPVYWAVEKGITTGFTDKNGQLTGYFKPGATCTRGQIVTFMWRAAGCPKVTATAATTFKDVKSGAYYYDAVTWAAQNGITTGYMNSNGKPSGKFGPEDPCTRAQIVTFLWRNAGEPVVSSSKKFSDVKKGAYYYNAVMWAASNNITTGYSGTDKFGSDDPCTRGQVVTFMFRAS